MKASHSLIAIYDFELFPYALGDVLTWNIRTAMRCEELGKKNVDVYICTDEKHSASIYQRGLINPDNFELFFSELYGAFGTNPKLGNIFIFRERESMIEQLQKIAVKDPDNLEALNDYLQILNPKVSDLLLRKVLKKFANKIRPHAIVKTFLKRWTPAAIQNNVSEEAALNHYFIKYIYSHQSINKFYETKSYIPLLKPSLGCTPDVDEIIGREFKDKKIVPFHLRLRRLDVGYGGDHTYTRDSDFLEWYDFLKNASSKYPDVQFVALGRLQEKPLEILRLPNVTSIRAYGMGLGHELTLMLRSDLFIGSSSGFAALANFSQLPYFITRMNPSSCDAYAIAEKTDQLPFAMANQKLIYEEETSDLLMNLLEKGLNLHEKTAPITIQTPQTNSINEWLKKRSTSINSSRTTCRFYSDDNYRHEETAYLLLPCLEKARQALENHDNEKAEAILSKLKQHFPGCLSLMEQFNLNETTQ